MKKFTLPMQVEVTKDQYAEHVQKDIDYWTLRFQRIEKENETKLSKYKEKLERREKEVQAIILKKKDELKALNAQ